MTLFLWVIGIYNLLGAFLLIAMQRERVANVVLHTATRILTEPYTHGPSGRMWLWWAAIAQIFIGGIMLLATGWPMAVAQGVTAMVLVVYVGMHLVMLLGAKPPKYGSGIYVTHVLWILQEIWAVLVVTGVVGA
tara:strand:+ start:130 stop:531 length:402 start_codon:yes stop_codon:yes gene_type:complete